jgi:hypothetical protein
MVNAAPHCGSGRIKAAAALRAAADHVAPVRAWHESTNDMAWERHQMTVIINNRILAIAAELNATTPQQSATMPASTGEA